MKMLHIGAFNCFIATMKEVAALQKHPVFLRHPVYAVAILLLI